VCPVFILVGPLAFQVDQIGFIIPVVELDMRGYCRFGCLIFWRLRNHQRSVALPPVGK
jgi:hypothetical protein